MRKTASIVLAALAAIGSAGAASAQAASVVIDYSDLDVTTPEGSAALEARIEAAARTVCRETVSPGVAAFQEYQWCKETAVKKAMEQLPEGAEVALGNPYEGLELASIF